VLWILGALGLLLALPVAGVLRMTAVPGRSHTGPLPPLTPDQAALAARLQDHVRAVAGRPHNLGNPEELKRAASYIETALEGMGYAVHRQPFSAGAREVRNIEAVIEPDGSAAANAKTLVVGAHYDSYGHAPGANDNGTGVAGVLELARLLADLRGRAALKARLRSHGAGSRLRLGWARRWSIRRIAARVTIASETSGSAS
jgi:Peptidase family M28